MQPFKNLGVQYYYKTERRKYIGCGCILKGRGVSEIINEAMTNIMREHEEFSAKWRVRKGERQLLLGEERRRLTEVASGKCLAFAVG